MLRKHTTMLLTHAVWLCFCVKTIFLLFIMACRYPALILTGFLYLGDWAHACDEARLRDIGVRR